MLVPVLLLYEILAIANIMLTQRQQLVLDFEAGIPSFVATLRDKRDSCFVLS